MFGISGDIGNDFAAQLAEQLAQQAAQQIARQQMEQSQQRIDLDRQSLNQRAREADDERGYREKTLEATDRARRDRANAAGMEDMYKQREIMDIERVGQAFEQIANDPNLPPHVRQVLQIQRAGGNNIRPADLEDPAAARERELGDYEAKKKIDAKYQRAPDERLVQIMGPEGKPIWADESEARGKPAAQAARAVTGQERQVLSFFNRAKQASDDIGGLEEDMAKSGMGAQLQQQYAPNMFQNEQQQRYRQAQRAFTEARLRKESGAAIPTAEYENDARTYFAQPGDSPEVIRQKRQARQVVLDGLKFASGKAYNEFYGDDGGARSRPADLVYDPQTKTFKPRGGQ